MGSARKVVITKDDTTIVEGAGDAADVEGRVSQIKTEIDNTDSDWDREKLQERLAKLAGGVAVVQVGAATEVELKETKHRIEDAISATRAAIDEGIVAGGGTALLRCRAANALVGRAGATAVATVFALLAGACSGGSSDGPGPDSAGEAVANAELTGVTAMRLANMDASTTISFERRR